MLSSSELVISHHRRGEHPFTAHFWSHGKVCWHRCFVFILFPRWNLCFASSRWDECNVALCPEVTCYPKPRYHECLFLFKNTLMSRSKNINIFTIFHIFTCDILQYFVVYIDFHCIIITKSCSDVKLPWVSSDPEECCASCFLACCLGIVSLYSCPQW